MDSSYNHKKIMAVIAAAAMFGVGPALATTTTPVFCNPSESINVNGGNVVAKNQSYKMEGATQPVSGTVVKYAEADSAICLLDDSHNEFTLTGSTTEFGVVVAVNDVTVNLDNASIAPNRGAGISFEDGFNATLKFKGNNYITGFDGYAGIAKTSESGKLTIDGTSKENTLGVNGGAGSAAIGGNSQQKMVSNIEILAGTINAVGGQYGAAIGGGQNGAASKITIGKETDKYYYNADDALTLSVTGGNDGGAGIGGGSMGGADTIVINNGYITANAPATAAIGAGAGMNCMDITINNGVLHAVGGTQSSAIGADGTTGTSCSGIVINNGSINAYAGSAASGDTKAIGKKESVTITGGSIMAVSSNETYDDIMDPKDAQGSPVHRFNIKATEKADDSLFVRSTTKGKFSAEAAVAQGEVFKNGGDWDNGKFFPTHHLDVDMNAGATINQQDQIWAFFGENEEHDLMVNPSVTGELEKTVASSGKTSRIKWDATQSKFIYNIALLNSVPHDFLVYNGNEQRVKVDEACIWMLDHTETLSTSAAQSESNDYFTLENDASITDANVKCKDEYVSRSVSVSGEQGAPVALYCDPAGFLTENAPENVYTMTAKDDIFYGAAKHEKFMLPYVFDNMDKEGSLEPQTNDAKDPIVLAGGFDHLVYNGKEQVQEVASVTLFNTKHYKTDKFQDYVLDATEDYEITGNKVTNASENYEMTISAKGTNFVGSAKRSFVVNQYDITGVDVKSEFENDLTYDPDPLSGNQIQKVKSASLEIGDTTVELTYSSSSKSVKDAGNYTIDLHGSGNFTGFHSAEFTVAPFDISKAGYQVAVTPDAYTSGDGDPTKLHVDYPVYNEESITQKFAVWTGANTLDEKTGEKVNYTYTGNTATEVGAYDIVVTGQGNYTGSISTTWFILDKNAVLVTIALKNDTAVYDGKERVWGGNDIIESATYVTADNQSADPLPFDVNDLVVSEGVSVRCSNVGDDCSFSVKSGDITVKNNDAAYVFVPDSSVKFVITPAPVTVAVAGKTDVATFDGKEHSLTGYDVKIPEEWAELLKQEEIVYSADSDTVIGTNVGEYNFSLVADSFKNANQNFDVAFNVTDGKLTIKPASVTIAVAGKTDTVTYNSKKHTLTGYNVAIPKEWEAFLKEEEIICNGCNSVVGTDAGEYPLVLKAENFKSNNDNFVVDFNVTNGSLVIDKAPVEVKITGKTETKSYAAKTFTVSGYDAEVTKNVSNVLFDKSDIVMLNGAAKVSAKNAGKYSMGLKAENFAYDNQNYNVTFTIASDGRLTIKPANVTVTITGAKDTVTYDGEKHSVSGYTVTASDSNFGSDDYEFIGKSSDAKVSGKKAGVFYMNLADSLFKFEGNNFTGKFVVKNGSLTIVKPKTEAIRATRVSLVRVRAIEGGIVVDNAYGKAISVFSVNGKTVYNNMRGENTSGSTIVNVPRGMYVVKVGGDIQRVNVQ